VVPHSIENFSLTMTQIDWTNSPELQSLLIMIDFNVSADENLETIRKHKNRIVFKVHPDKNRHDVSAANEAVKLWNEAFDRITEFLEISVEENDYSYFKNERVDNIFIYMNEYGIEAIESNEEFAKSNEDQAFNAQILENAKQADEIAKTLEKINREADEAHEKQEQGMYIDANILM
jgi:curved DNA-binding protein CbpA